MVKHSERRFKIDVFTPDTLPMERLAEYMREFARLLGEPERVHFVDVESGSAVLRARIENVAVSKVERRLAQASRGQGDPVALKAMQNLDELLVGDNAVGQLVDESGAEIIAFRGRNRPKPIEYGPFREDGVLEGVVIKVGGTAASVPIWLRDGETIYKNCTARPPLDSQLSEHYRRGLLRVYGSGSWMRLSTGAWLMRSFEIRDFSVLDDAPLNDVIERLHQVEGAKWGDDPVGDLARLRAGEDLN